MKEEQEAQKDYVVKQGAYVSFLKQKAKLDWIREGDENTKIFHQSIKKRRLQNTIHSIQDVRGDTREGLKEIAGAFIDYYKQLLGGYMPRFPIQDQFMGGVRLSADQINVLSLPFTRREVKSAMFSIHGDKAPGPDGFGSFFFRDHWDIVGESIEEAVLDVLNSGKLLKELNHTLLSMIPKSSCPTSVTEFRPISCCNTLYKCITKVLCSRLRMVLPSLISLNQGAFVQDRYIVHNILVCQDLIRHYGRRNNRPSCMIKLDLRKAYDTVEWGFIEEMMTVLGFPDHFIALVMMCVSSPTFSLVINGCSEGFFPSKRGLRHGDPMSPLLFVLCMEYLTRVMNCMTADPVFKFHPRCKGAKLSHMCFADDLILCCHGDIKSVEIILEAFAIFSSSTRLCANKGKTEVYCSGVEENIVKEILNLTGFVRGSLPFKYLGVPISPRRLAKNHCEVLLDKMSSRIRTRSSRHLSFAARSVLVNSVLMAVHSYWAHVFLLPKSVIDGIEKICRSFLWYGTSFSTNPGAIKWEDVCKRKKDGGLGFRNIGLWNIAMLGKHVWAIATKQDNLWIKWVHSIYIKNQDWWDYQPPVDASWSWKRICAVKEDLKHRGLQQQVRSMQKYSASQIYWLLVGEERSVSWSEVVWNRFNIPKHGFCAWLCMAHRLKTKDRMYTMGICKSLTCLLCGRDDENHQHLFFDCQFSRCLLHDIKVWFGITNQATDLHQVIRRFQRSSASRFQRRIFYAAICALIYMIWKYRNDVLWQNQKNSTDVISKQIRQMVVSRIQVLNVKNMRVRDQIWLDSMCN
ncbi:LINE-1 retrotransposable element ORF2 protein [Bienertia sinuspersici]